MRFQKLDLNLLVALDALLQERSVSLAADRLHLSQSATSSALARLRDYFDDPLLVLKGRQMVLTPRGEDLVAPVAAVLEQIRSTIAVSEPFEPAQSKRTIRIMASDYTLEVLIRPALLDLTAEAPFITFEITPMSDYVVEELQRGRSDLLITIDTALSTEHPSVPLYEDDFVAVGWSENSLLSSKMTPELYCELGHVIVRFGFQRTPSFEEWALRSRSINRKVEIVAPSFSSVASFLIGSNRIATMHRRLATHLAKSMPLRIMEMPFTIPSIRQAAQWATSSDGDKAIKWVATRLADIAKSDNF